MVFLAVLLLPWIPAVKRFKDSTRFLFLIVICSEKMKRECMPANKAFVNACYAIGYIAILDNVFFQNAMFNCGTG